MAGHTGFSPVSRTPVECFYSVVFIFIHGRLNHYFQFDKRFLIKFIKGCYKDDARNCHCCSLQWFGKTTVTLGLIRALTRQFPVVPFKIGPDYIDPSYHQAAAKNEPHNLDLFLLGEENLKKIFFKSIKKGEMAIVEGVMGLFDGLGTESWASTAHVAKILKLPVILVVDVRSMSTSAAALVHGFQTYDPELQLVGVICNLTSSKTHYNHVKKSIERDCNLQLLVIFLLKIS